jgi:hypothetical protein
MKKVLGWLPLLLCLWCAPAYAQTLCADACDGATSCSTSCQGGSGEWTTCGGYGLCSGNCSSYCSSSTSCYDGCDSGGTWTTCGAFGVCESCGNSCGAATPCGRQCMGSGLTTCGGASQQCADSCGSACNGGASCGTYCADNEFYTTTCQWVNGWVAAYGPVIRSFALVNINQPQTKLIYDIKSCGDPNDPDHPTCRDVFVGGPCNGSTSTCCSAYGRSGCYEYDDNVCPIG